MRIATQTDRGLVRKRNEDSVLADEGLGLLMIADGMGGYSGGEIASALAVSTVHACLLGSVEQDSAGRDTGNVIREAVRRADEAIRLRASGDARLGDMGTTLVLALCRGPRVHLAHAGDSRAYLMQNGVMRRLTRDHSLVSEMIENGEITPKEARRHPLRNVVTRSLGSHGNAELGLQTVAWEPGNCLLLCSDGLTNMVEDREIERAIRQAGPDLSQACEKLVQMANQAGGKDNISVILALQE
jgi:serine/threonine protein phosphatase PrpC